jgi:hypothetical protein
VERSSASDFSRNASLAVVASALAAYLCYDAYAGNPKFTSDFGQWWLGAKTLLNGESPYLTNGPGNKYPWPWDFTYPLPAAMLAVPFAWLPEMWGAVAFVAGSAAIMVFAITRNGFHLTPMLLSVPFQMSASLAQWSLLLTAAVFYPWLSFLLVVKPQAAIPVWRWNRIGAAFGFALLIVSLVLIPDWPLQWYRVLAEPENHSKYLSPVTAVGGFLLPLVLLKWRRREAWLLFLMAVIPQSVTFYFLLPLFTIPKDWRESIGLLGVSTFGIYLGALLMPELSQTDFYHWSLSVAVLSTYIPCLILVLLRKNEAQESALSPLPHYRWHRRRVGARDVGARVT